MLKQTEEKQIYRRGLSKRGWANFLLFWLIASIGLTLSFRYLSERDARIAEREKIVIGSINAIHKGKGDPADYTFQFENVNYLGRDDSNFLGLTVGGTAKVFVDSQNPNANGLRSFAFKSALNHDCMAFAFYLTIALAIVAGILWLRLLNSREIKIIGEGLKLPSSESMSFEARKYLRF
jgi:hypothetical protein